MHKKIRIIFLLLLCCGARLGHSQLSPGDLSKYHADLEGLLNCTKCHNLGEGISQTKCLACHTELKQRIDQNKGYHISNEVKAVSCIDCHSDHHGRNFEIIRFDQSNFDHQLTGYKLEDAHAKQECIACHKDAFISDKKIRDKEYTFLGLDTKCSTCHQDVHQGSLNTNCASCHDFKAFKPANLFDHAQSEFVLKGKHLEVDCIKCHPINQKNGQDFQVFNGLEFGNCTSCHEDQHDNRFGQNCVACHTEESWHLFKGMGNFNHNKTDFSLTGRHRTTDCIACHKNGTDNSNPFKEYVTWKTFDCASCHHDVHESKLGNDCKVCHNTQSFISLNKDHRFDHSMTDYPLSGKHLEVDCKSCHEGSSKLEAIEFDRCNLCHADYHEGQFKNLQGVTTDCAQCHTVTDFAESSFSIDDHNQTSFSLEGAHLATPCFSCHLTAEAKWEFRNIGSLCVDCHVDIHQGILDTKFYPEKQCQHCHTVNTWPDIHFDHNQTNFALEGKHLEQQCNACHLVHGIDSEHQLFSGLTSRCVDCHVDIHQGQFLLDGLTDCNRCHAFSNWEASRFNHDETDFRLEGAHLKVDCIGCHKETQQENRNYINYQIEDHSCASCHL